MISPELGALRQQRRFRRLVVQQTVMFQNVTAGLLMGAGVEYERRRLHGKRDFQELLQDNPWISQQLRPLLWFNREQIETLQGMDTRLVRWLSASHSGKPGWRFCKRSMEWGQ